MAVDLTLAKQHLRVDGTDEDTLVGVYLSAAKAWVEGYTGKLLTRGETGQVESGFGEYIALHRGPAPENVGITYTDTDDAAQTITDAAIVGSRIYYPAGWPTTADATEIVVTYTAGFDETPADLDAAVLLLVGEFYANREAGAASQATTMAVEALCRPYRAVLV